MPRDINAAKQRKALRKLRRAAAMAESGEGPPLTEWEETFLEELEARIEQFGSAFNDPEKGNLDEPLSALQTQKLREIDKKARGKGKTTPARSGNGFTRKAPNRIKFERTENDPPPPPMDAVPPSPTPGKRPALRVIRGGRDENAS